MDSNRIVVVGRIGSSYGVKGWTHVRSYTEPVENLTDFPQLYGRRNEEPWRKLGSIEFRRHRDGLIAKIDGCDDRTEASTLSNLELGVQRDVMPPLEEGEFYWVDLIGLDVVNIEDTTLGKISKVIETDASPILDVKAANTHYLIPFVKPVLDSVELTSHVRVNWDKDWLA